MRLIFPFKLVRDHMVAVIEEQGGRCIFRQLVGEEYRKALKEKLAEEAKEVLKTERQDDLTSELADVLEIVEAIRIANRIREQDLAKYRHNKRLLRGGFTRGIKLYFAFGGNMDHTTGTGGRKLA